MIRHITFKKILHFIPDHGVNIGIFGFFSWSFLFSPARNTNPLDYDYNSKAAGVLMVAAWFSQLAGAYLKRFPFQRRLGAAPALPPSDDEEERSSLHPLYSAQESKIFFFMLMYPIVSGLLLGMGLSNIFPALRHAADQFHWWTIPYFTVFLSALAIQTVFTVQAMMPVNEVKPVCSWMNSEWAEYIADQLLIFSFIILFSSIFGTGAMMQGIKPVNPAGLLDWLFVIFLILPLLWFCIMLIFIPYRILLMLEDFGTWRSRLSSMLAVSPIIIKYIFGG